MQELFDETVKHLKGDKDKDIQQLRQAFEYMEDETANKLDKKDLKRFISRVETLD